MGTALSANFLKSGEYTYAILWVVIQLGIVAYSTVSESYLSTNFLKSGEYTYAILWVVIQLGIVAYSSTVSEFDVKIHSAISLLRYICVQ